MIAVRAAHLPMNVSRTHVDHHRFFLRCWAHFVICSQFGKPYRLSGYCLQLQVFICFMASKHSINTVATYPDFLYACNLFVKLNIPLDFKGVRVVGSLL